MFSFSFQLLYLSYQFYFSSKVLSLIILRTAQFGFFFLWLIFCIRKTFTLSYYSQLCVFTTLLSPLLFDSLLHLVFPSLSHLFLKYFPLHPPCSIGFFLLIIFSYLVCFYFPHDCNSLKAKPRESTMWERSKYKL